MTDITASGARSFAVLSISAANVIVPAGRTFGIINYPSNGIRASTARIAVVEKAQSDIDVAGVRVFAVVSGRVANPSVRAWTFTLDGHDFYVLRLGDAETLIYDCATEQWVQWDSPDSGAWRPNIGTTWVGAQALGQRYGSNVVAGDDTFGVLWFLNPKAAYDQHPDYSRARQQIDFTRIVTAQVLQSGRDFKPCYSLSVDGDNYGLTATDFVPVVTLETSDDQGRTFDAHETLTVDPDASTINNPYGWYSLGQISSPGRIFRITDNGLFARIDAAEMNDGG